MSSPFVGEIRIFGFNFPPRGWAACNGQLLPISQNTALFSLLGTTYGGNGKTNFALPNLQGCAPLHPTRYGGSTALGTYALGQAGGETAVTLTAAQMPAHTHGVQCSTSPGATVNSTLAGNVWAVAAATRGLKMYADSAGTGALMNAAAVGIAGSGLPHNNMPPYLVLNFCIALQGIYPARN